MKIRQSLLILITGILLLKGYVRLQAQVAPGQIEANGHVILQATKQSAYVPHVPVRALAYQRIERILGLFATAWSMLGLWLALRTGFAALLRDKVYQWLSLIVPPNHSPPAFRATAAYYLLISSCYVLWNIPTGLASQGIEHYYGFSTESVKVFARDALQSELIGCTAIPFLWIAYVLIARSPKNWWKWIWVAAIPLLFSLMVFVPLVISPLYNHYSPLPEGKTRSDILALANKAGIQGAHVFVEDTSRRTSHVNAYVTGLGPSARIVINDTALHVLPEDQLLAMVGHEMGHYIEGHIWVLFLSSVLGTGVFLFLTARISPYLVDRYRRKPYCLQGILDLAAFPLMLLWVSIFLLVQEPIANTVSRTLEHRADAFGLHTTQLNDATARLFVGFAERDYSDPDPPALLHFWFGTHPTLSERIAFARAYPKEEPGQR